MQSLLSGVRVLDLSRILAGPWATQLLADMGAEVIKIERPGKGDDTRAAGPPFLQSAQGPLNSESAYYLSANRNKRSVTLDFTQPEGQAILLELVRQADVVVENYKVGNLARYGLDYESLKKVRPDLVYCSITGFGQTGPLKDRPGYDFIFQGMSGLMSITGERDDLPGGGPQKVGVAVMDLMTGMYSAVAILGALLGRKTSGEGQYIDVALLDVGVASLANMVSNYLVSGKEPCRMGNAHANLVPYGVFPAADGHIILAIGNDSQFRAFCQVAGCDALADDQRFATNAGRIVNRQALIPQLEAITATRNVGVWIEQLEAAKVSCGPINSIAQALATPQVQQRGIVKTVEHPGAGTVQLVGNPIRFSNADMPVNAPPMLGQHTREVLSELCGRSAADVAALQARGIV
jgi:crotonobetainyl-CoA:carnitine CoA-transferase CaiB-like acyl-CoA transferase